MADRLANALERGWYFRKAGHTTLERIMDAGALGAEIVLSGKVTGARSRVEKFNDGYIKHNGEPAETIVDHGQGVAVMKLGTIGVDVKIIPPGAELPDDFRIEEDADVSELAAEVETDEGVEELLEEPEDEELEELEDEAAEAEADADDEVVEEVIETDEPDEEFEEVDVPEGDDEIAEELDDLEADVEEEADELVDEMEEEIDDEEGDA